MKRKTLKSIACATIMALTLSVTACGGSGDTAPAADTEATDDAAESEAATDDAAESEAATDDAAESETTDDTAAADDTAEADAEAESTDDTAAAGETVESLLNDPAAKAQYEEAFAEYEEQGMTVAVDAKGNELLMSLTIQDASLITDETAGQLQSALDQSEAVFAALAAALDTSVGGEPGTCTYSVSYLDPDGNVLAEKSFKAQ